MGENPEPTEAQTREFGAAIWAAVAVFHGRPFVTEGGQEIELAEGQIDMATIATEIGTYVTGGDWAGAEAAMETYQIKFEQWANAHVEALIALRRCARDMGVPE